MPKQAKTKTMTLLALNRKSVKIRIVGLTPLLTNRFSESKIQGMEDAQTGRSHERKAPRNPEKEFEDAIHDVDPSDKGTGIHGGFPANGIKRALVRAGKYCGETMTDLCGAIQIMGDVIPIKSSPPKMRRDRVNST